MAGRGTRHVRDAQSARCRRLSPPAVARVKIAIVAMGRLARSPETELVKLYLERATNAGRALSLGPVEVVEVEARKPGKGA
jgi:hypothetical protein